MPSSDKKQWQKETLEPAVKKFPERREKFQTDSGLDIDPLYTPDDLPPEDLDYNKDLGYPGEFPYTRGVQPNTYRGRVWTMRQYSGYGTAADTNQRYRYLLDQGQTGLSVAFDLPTQIGYDSDHRLANGEVGKVGVPICSLADMETLFDGIPMDKVSTSMTINATASIMLCFYIAAAKKQGVSQEQISGTVQNDILKEYIARGTYAYPPRPSMRLVVDVFKYCAENVPKWNTISISGYHIREAGATAAQELAFTLADGFAYVEAACERGLDVDSFAPRLSFFFNAHSDFFEEIAKFRAARRIWARVMREKYGAKNPRSWWMRFHTQTAGCSLSAQQPENNVVRTAIEALAAVLGGTQSLHTNSMDEALALPSEKAVTIALRTQQIIAHESGVTNTVDPLAGSYFVEALTDRLEAEVHEYFRKIEALGGVIPAIEVGFFQREIAEAAFRYQQEIDSGRRVIVGVNRYAAKDPLTIPLLEIDAEGERRQIERLRRVRAERDDGAMQRTLARLRDAARGDGNLMYPILEAVKAYATLGEICDVFREVFGEYQESVFF
ncbi:MAG: methylmalonyl-CoA mutase family protein [SAR202 cluster bacterium]|nr:methylmalonyl-CoA mutase family protein [SAR202 cluster bacterium]